MCTVSDEVQPQHEHMGRGYGIGVFIIVHVVGNFIVIELEITLTCSRDVDRVRSQLRWWNLGGFPCGRGYGRCNQALEDLSC